MAKKSIILEAEDFYKSYGTPNPLVVRLLEDNNTPVPNKPVNITINGVTYTRNTDYDGYARLNINLISGTYPTTVRFPGDDTYINTQKNITVTVVQKMYTMQVSDLVKKEGNPEPLTVRLLNGDSVVTNHDVQYVINGVTYIRKTDNQGYSRLNINLGVGVYNCVVTALADEYYIQATRTVKVTVQSKKGISIVAPNFTKTYGTKDAFKVTVYDNGTPFSYKEIKITINGVNYSRTTDSTGSATLNINLNPGVYPVTVKFEGNADYKAVSKECTVTVKSNTMVDGFNVTKKYGDPGFYQCAVYDQWHRINPCSVDLRINGVTYTRSTDKDGLIKLNINLLPGTYQIDVTFKGTATLNPSYRTDYVVVKPEIEQITYKTGTISTPENNIGFMKSHVYVTRVSMEKSKADKTVYDLPNWDELIKQNGGNDNFNINFTSYEITETDPRVKTAKFVSDKYIDLTKGRSWVYITSPYHENFGGRILKVDFDKNNGLYTYQCQDGRRQYLSKRRTCIPEDANITIYDEIKYLLVSPVFSDTAFNTVDDFNKIINSGSPLVAGLQPIDNYKQKLDEITKPVNNMAYKCPPSLSFDRTIDKILNYAHYGGNVDVWFDPSGLCHIDPIDLDKWLRRGIKLTHADLVQYKYGFDTTNIITGVAIKQNNSENNELVKQGNNWEELKFYFGANISLIDPITNQVATDTNNSTTGTGNGVVINSKTGCRDNSGANIPKNMPIVISIDNIWGYSADKQFMENVASRLRSQGYTDVRVSGVGPGYHNSDVERASPNTCCLTIFGGYCACTFSDYWGYLKSKIKSGVRIVAGFTNMPNYHANKPSSTNPNGTHLDKITWLPKPWDMSCGISGISNPGQKILDAGVNWVYGDTAEELADNLAKGNSGGSTGTPSTNASQTTTVVDENATYNKALEEMANSVRDLLSFEIKVPLNSQIFKNLHTNMMLWTELPADFKLANLEKIFKILPSFKVNRGVSYMENRWYVEQVKINMDNKGLFATIKLNPFPSSNSSYGNAIKSYQDAYNQAFNQPTTTTNTATASGGKGQARLGNDGTDTNSMRAMSGGCRGNAGDNRNFDEAAKRGYAQEGRKYYEWARKYDSPLALAKALANRFQYEGYYNNKDANAEVTHNNGGTIYCNCYDACRYVKCCFDAAGFDAVVITGSIYQGGHGWNAVKHNGRWYTFDLCYAVTGKEWAGTNTLRLCNEW